ncbi:MAG: hypothetical protein KVP17_000125 [Porospora cf. gigantea B]|nr:MAG: hypothetical protein KVP17_000125 [Porospora cf. gigantea B]
MDLGVIISDMPDNLCRLVDVALEPLLCGCGLTSSKDLPEVLHALSDADICDVAEVLWELRNEKRSFKEHLECSTKRNAFFSECQPAPNTTTPSTGVEEVEEFNYPRRKHFASTAAYAK